MEERGFLQGVKKDSKRVSKKESKTGVSKKESKIGKIAKGVLQKYSPHGLDSRQRGGVIAPIGSLMPYPFHLSKFPELHHLRNYRHFLKIGDKTQGKDADAGR